MATPIGTILGVGMLGLAAVVLVAATMITAFVELPEETGDLMVLARPAGGVVRGERVPVVTAL